MARPLFSCRGVIIFTICAPHKERSGTLTWLRQLQSGMLGINCPPVKHRYIYFYYRPCLHNSANSEVEIKDTVHQLGLEACIMIR